ncbi:hypothetical protein ACLI09_13230 [Flavobacterium sp. RHBU_24]|uniref:hypothetical protein n=1 Tax=Flavobacterium sp. RHBU_24 TaxID=3391185 RepID=UPI00398509DF
MKTSIINYTYLYFFFASLGIFLYALIIMIGGQGGMVGFTLFNRYMYLDGFQLSILFKVAYLVLALGYYFADRLNLQLNKKVTLLHAYITIGAVLLNAIVVFINSCFVQNYTYVYRINEIISLGCCGTALLAQPLFLWNLLQAVLKKNN